MGDRVVQIKTALGWEPVVTLKEGLALMVEDFSQRLSKHIFSTAFSAECAIVVLTIT